MIVEWAPIAETETVPFMGDALTAHLADRKGAVLHASCSAWNLLYRMLTENGLPVGTAAFTKEGKPYFTDADVCFSISHTKGVCAVAVSDRPVGVDIERRGRTYSPRAIEKALTEKEKAAYDGDFTRIWGRKEAAAKMTGDGIKKYPDDLETSRYSYSEQCIEFGGEEYWLIVCEASAENN